MNTLSGKGRDNNIYSIRRGRRGGGHIEGFYDFLLLLFSLPINVFFICGGGNCAPKVIPCIYYITLN